MESRPTDSLPKVWPCSEPSVEAVLVHRLFWNALVLQIHYEVCDEKSIAGPNLELGLVKITYISTRLSIIVM